MRLLKKILLAIVVLILIFVAHVLISTGFFRSVESKFEGEILKKIPITGAEDITISRTDSFALISATARPSYPPNKQERGEIYLIDLKTSDYQPKLLSAGFTKPFAPHGISILKTGEKAYLVMVINHTEQGHSIEVFNLNNHQLSYVKSLTDPAMISPNDLFIVDENRFYFTNDHGYVKGLGRIVEEYTGLGWSNVVYFDGTNYKEVADGIAYANGINADLKRNLLFVASPRKFLVKVYAIKKDGVLSFVENIPCGTGVDNIEMDQQGHLWIGAHPNLLQFGEYAKGKKKTAPSEIIEIIYKEKGDYSMEQIYLDDGKDMSGASVAVPFGDLIFAGNVKDDHFLILKR